MKTMGLQREPNAKAQLTSAVVAVVSYVIAKYLKLLPEELDLITPLIAYAVAQVVTWLWARRLTTPIASPALAEGTEVKLPDGTAGKVVSK